MCVYEVCVCVCRPSETSGTDVAITIPATMVQSQSKCVCVCVCVCVCLFVCCVCLLTAIVLVLDRRVDSRAEALQDVMVRFDFVAMRAHSLRRSCVLMFDCCVVLFCFVQISIEELSHIFERVNLLVAQQGELIGR